MGNSELDRCLMALRLEVPQEVADVVERVVRDRVAELETTMEAIHDAALPSGARTFDDAARNLAYVRKLAASALAEQEKILEGDEQNA